MRKYGCIGDAVVKIQNGINCKQDKSGVGNKITRIETIADAEINFKKTGFAQLSQVEIEKAQLEENDILFSHINSPIHVGKTAIYKGEEPLWHGINLLRMKTIDDVDAGYFNYFLKLLFWSGYWRRTAKQSVNQASVNQKDIKAVPFSYPPLAEQQRIVAKLDAAFAEIDEAVEVTKNSLLSLREFNEKFISDTFKSIGTNWLTGRISDFCSLKSGSTVDKKFEVEVGDIAYLKVADMNISENQNSIVTSSRFLKTSDVRQTQIIEAGSIIFPKRGGAILTNKKRITDVPICADLNIMSVKSNGSIQPKLLFYYFQNVDMRQLGSGSSIPQINNYDIEPLKISFPKDPAEQSAIVIKLDDVTQTITGLSKIYDSKIAALSSLKSAILAEELQSEAA